MEKCNYILIIAFMLGMVNDQLKSVSGLKRKSPRKSQPPDTVEQFRADSLKLHNEYRSKHGSGPLTLNETLTLNAQKWANKLTSLNKVFHQTHSPYGENLYSIRSTGPLVVKAKNVVFSWYREGKQYNYSKEATQLVMKKAGHFTQVVWKGSKYLGIGRSKNKRTGRTVIVATYYPPGNYRGSFRKNVLRPKK